jgi:seryl-tRNA synthetase
MKPKKITPLKQSLANAQHTVFNELLVARRKVRKAETQLNKETNNTNNLEKSSIQFNPKEKSEEYIRAVRKKRHVIKKFSRVRQTRKIVDIFENMRVGNKVKLITVRGTVHSGKVTKIDLNEGVIYLKPEIFSKPIAYNMAAFKARLK